MQMLRKIPLPAAQLGDGDIGELRIEVDKTFVPGRCSPPSARSPRTGRPRIPRVSSNLHARHLIASMAHVRTPLTAAFAACASCLRRARAKAELVYFSSGAQPVGQGPSRRRRLAGADAPRRRRNRRAIGRDRASLPMRFRIPSRCWPRRPRPLSRRPGRRHRCRMARSSQRCRRSTGSMRSWSGP